MILPIVQPKSPNGPGWAIHPNPAVRVLDSQGFPHKSWYHADTGLLAISSLNVVDQPGRVVVCPEYHLSVSLAGQRCSAADAFWVLLQFHLLDAREDNQVPSSKARNFWRPVADPSGYENSREDEQPSMRKNMGEFVWRGLRG